MWTHLRQIHIAALPECRRVRGNGCFTQNGCRVCIQADFHGRFAANASRRRVECHVLRGLDPVAAAPSRPNTPRLSFEFPVSRSSRPKSAGFSFEPLVTSCGLRPHPISSTNTRVFVLQLLKSLASSTITAHFVLELMIKGPVTEALEI